MSPLNPIDERSLQIVLWLAATAFFMQTLDATIVNTALPAMAASLGESPLRMQSVVIAYTLTMALLIPASGWLADRFGTRRVFFSAILLFVIGSLLCARSTSLTQLVLARVIQGAGGAMLLPVGRLAVLRTFPRERYLHAISFIAVPGLLGPLIGPTLGGWLVEVASWHWIFLINIPVGIIGCAITWRWMTDSRNPGVMPFDIKGYLLLAAGMAAVSLALDGLSHPALPKSIALALLLFGVASLYGYWMYARRRQHPLFSLKLFEVKSFKLGLIGNLLARTGAASMPFLIPLMLQLALGYDPSKAGMMMLPVAAAGMAAKPIVTRLIRRYGYRQVLIGNTLLIGTMIASFALTSSTQPVWLQVMHLALFGAVNSMQFTAMNTITLRDLGSEGASSGNSMLSVTQMLAMSLGVTVGGGLLGVFSGMAGRGGNTLPAFHATFICVGLITSASAFIFWRLAADRTAVR